MNEKKYKHLTEEDRQTICDLLCKGMDFKTIGKAVGKDQTTISKEVKKHTIVRTKPVLRNDSGAVIDYPLCPMLLKAPYVCNACSKFHCVCKYEKHVYIPGKAHQAYRELLSEARTGIALNSQSFWDMDKIIAEKVRFGQHLYQIAESNDFTCSLSSIYRYMNEGYLSASKIDLPRAVKFKPRKKDRNLYVPKACKAGRTYDDFLVYIQENDISSWVEMDTVIGNPGGKVILTLNFTVCNFMIGLILENKTAAEVASKIRWLKNSLKTADSTFHDYFPVIITDNGSEFADINSIIYDDNGKKETELFFCDPMSSWQKPQIEKNHTLFRDIAPKGTSFDALTQKDLSVIFSHINSVKRKKLFGKTPYEIFTAFFGSNFADLISIYPVKQDEVIQTPKLLKELIRQH